ncbi:MAG: transglycosylase SLT domain-containing protein [Legionellales bacterium]|nr:transglycosylase SLT domain-containing protein [Legionellales bacterium]
MSCKALGKKLFLLGILLFPIVTGAYAGYSVWDVLRQQFVLNHETSRPEVQAQLSWLLRHPHYIQSLTQSEPYIYHIITEIKKRNLPGELALIPMVESAFNPFAYSGAGAAGLWQLMPGTGTDLGLKQDWWYDGRRSIPSSTDAALNYLELLHHTFHQNWILAFAAYDAGAGNIERIIQARQNGDFWTLPVPRETQTYIPRILALAEIIQNPQRYHVQLPNIPHTPYFAEVNIGSQIDLGHAATLAGISYQDLIKLNPGYNRWTTAPNQPYKLLIPASKVLSFNHNLANVPQNKRVAWTRYLVRAGDTLHTIAARHHTTVNLIQELNQLSTNTLPKGQYILIPNNMFAANTIAKRTRYIQPQAYKIIYIVDKKDNFKTLTQKLHVTEQQIKAWNHLDDQAELHPGQNLMIWQSTQDTTYAAKHGNSVKRYFLNIARVKR